MYIVKMLCYELQKLSSVGADFVIYCSDYLIGLLDY